MEESLSDLCLNKLLILPTWFSHPENTQTPHTCTWIWSLIGCSHTLPCHSWVNTLQSWIFSGHTVGVYLQSCTNWPLYLQGQLQSNPPLWWSSLTAKTHVVDLLLTDFACSYYDAHAVCRLSSAQRIISTSEAKGACVSQNQLCCATCVEYIRAHERTICCRSSPDGSRRHSLLQTLIWWNRQIDV